MRRPLMTGDERAKSEQLRTHESRNNLRRVTKMSDPSTPDVVVDCAEAAFPRGGKRSGCLLVGDTDTGCRGTTAKRALMARVRVRIDDLERGDLPALSVKTGKACANPVAIVLRPEQRPWSPSGRKIAVVVPLEPARARTRRRLTRISWAFLVAGAAALV